MTRACWRTRRSSRLPPAICTALRFVRMARWHRGATTSTDNWATTDRHTKARPWRWTHPACSRTRWWSPFPRDPITTSPCVPTASVAAWGFNNHGQLGDGTRTTARTPVLVKTDGVLAGKQVVAVAAGAYQSYALCSDGTLAAWGYNDEGELGNGGNTGSLVPVAVDVSGALAGRKVAAIAAGHYHALALCTDGSVVSWGYNQRGQLGNSSTTHSASPMGSDRSARWPASPSGPSARVLPTASRFAPMARSPPGDSTHRASWEWRESPKAPRRSRWRRPAGRSPRWPPARITTCCVSPMEA